jgi:hypothetical protein
LLPDDAGEEFRTNPRRIPKDKVEPATFCENVCEVALIVKPRQLPLPLELAPCLAKMAALGTKSAQLRLE